MVARRTVTIAGAGYAGLSAGYYLRKCGFDDFDILDARGRPGGRASSNTSLVPGCVVDEGPEFVGANHYELVRLAEEHGVELLRMQDYEGPFSRTIPGAGYTSARCTLVTKDLGKVAARLVDDARVVNLHEPWLTPDAERLDCTSLAAWLEQQSDVSADCRRAFEVQVVANHGVKLERLSLLAFLVLVKAHGLERYLDQTELFRLRGGAQSVANRLAEGLAGHLHFNSPIASIEERGECVVVRARSGREFHSEYLILTIPPSVWESIRFAPALPQTLCVQMGMHTKVFAVLEGNLRFEAGLSPYALRGTGLLQLVWNATEAQNGTRTVITGFSGGASAVELGRLAQDELRLLVTGELGELIPELKQRLVSVSAKPWPRDPFTRAGYSAPAPGQITGVWPQYHLGVGRIIFAGEYFARQWAFMNGAICSGANAVGRMMEMRSGRVSELAMIHA